MQQNSQVTVATVTSEPTLRHTQNGTAILEIPTGNISEHDGRGVPAYRRVTAFAGLAETLAELLKVGDVIHIDGKLRQDRYTAQDGSNRSSVEVVANRVTVLDAAQFEISEDAKGQPLLRNGKNVTSVSGNLTKDVETLELDSGRVSKGSVAINERYTNRDGEQVERTHFVDFEAWDGAADILEGMTKGRGVLLSGPLVTQSWEDKDGNRRYRTVIKVTEAYSRPARS